MRHLFFIFVAFASQTAIASGRSTLKFQCSGEKVSGVIQIDLSQDPSAHNRFPSFTSRSKLVINGRQIQLFNRYDVSYFQREVPFGHGAWTYDYNIEIFSIGGGELRLAPQSSFHLETDRSFGNVRGYLGYRDHRSSVFDNPHYDFTCRAF